MSYDPATGQYIPDQPYGAGGGMSAAYSQPTEPPMVINQQPNMGYTDPTSGANINPASATGTGANTNVNAGVKTQDPYAQDPTLAALMLSQQAASYGGGGSSKNQAIGSTAGMAAGAGIGAAVGGPPGALIGASLGGSAGGGIGSMFGGSSKETQAEKQQKEVTKNMQHKRYYRSSSIPQAQSQVAANVISGKEPTAGMSKVEQGMMTPASPYQNAAISNQMLNLRLRRSLMGARLAAVTPILVMMGMATRGGR